MARIFDKLFPRPEPGSAKIIPSRHEVQISLMVSFIIAAGFYIWKGAAGASALSAAPMSVILVIALVSIMGAGLCLVSAVIAEKHPWNALGCSLSGFTLLTVMLSFNTWNYVQHFPEFYASGPFWTTACLTIGFAWRATHLAVDATRIWRHK